MLAVDAGAFPRVGRKQFPATLPLARGEFVLTFDDGPWPRTTGMVLDALRAQCVRATFFVLGQNATEHPDLLRRELADGHTVAHHTWSHPLLNRMSVSAAETQIQRGFTAVDEVLYGKRGAEPATPFFRFPGFAASTALLEALQRRGVVVFGADLWASDWNAMGPDAELRLVLNRMEQAGRGIVLFHDTKRETAAMLPALLRAMKARGYRVVHVVPPGPSLARRVPARRIGAFSLVSSGFRHPAAPFRSICCRKAAQLREKPHPAHFVAMEWTWNP